MNLHASDNALLEKTPEQTLLYVIAQLCQQVSLPYSVIDNTAIVIRDRIIGQRTNYRITESEQLQIEHLGTSNKTHGYRLTYIISNNRPYIFVATDHTCAIRIARRILYNEQLPRSLQLLDTQLKSASKDEAIKPAVPAGTDSGGIRVGIVDSGVNFLLPQIAKQLARNSDGSIIGYDFWDLDALPYDNNPARSVFFPQRHGTRTAMLLLNEATNVSLVPYRYPRPDMSRMSDLIQHAAKHHVKIIAMPLGSKDKNQWQRFRQSAEDHPEILFIVSSGNNGVDIDQHPIYPASFKLKNMIVVSSADEYPRPASRTNWGKISTDILLPADRQYSIDFNGSDKMVSGTSYAVSRLAALAARLKKQHPDWSAKQLKKTIITMADKKLAQEYTAHGLLADPLIDTATITVIGKTRLPSTNKKKSNSLPFKLNVVILKNSGWTILLAKQAARQTTEIYASCDITLQITLIHLEVSDYLLDFHSLTSRTLIEKTNHTNPTIFLVRNTRRSEAFGGEAFGENNSKRLPWLKNTAWLTAKEKDSGITMAHELFHILVDNGDHKTRPGNLMNSKTEVHNTQLTMAQCETIKQSKLLRLQLKESQTIFK